MDITSLYAGMWLPRWASTAIALGLILLGALVVLQVGAAMEKRADTPAEQRDLPIESIELPAYRSS